MQQPEQRREPRYALKAEAIIERASGEKLSAFTINVSASGALLELEQPPALELGETVTCGLKLYSDKPPQSWGTGRVVRLSECRVAIDFHCVGRPDDSAPHA